MSNTPKESTSHPSSLDHTSLQKSFTLSRKYVNRPIISVKKPLRTALQSTPIHTTPIIQHIADITPAKTTAVSPEAELNSELEHESDHKIELKSEPKSKPSSETNSDLESETKLDSDLKSEFESESNKSKSEFEPESKLKSESESAPELTASQLVSEPTPPYTPNDAEQAFAQPTASDQAFVQSIDEETTPPLTPRELKNEAIQKALSDLNQQREDSAFAEVVSNTASEPPASKRSSRLSLSSLFSKQRRRGSVHKFILAFATSAVCIGILGYFVSLNLPSISVRVAAMQTGIEATYPNYVPRGYQLTSVHSNDDRTSINMTFTDDSANSFTLLEENSSWDTNSLLNNYVKPEWLSDYTVVREQGITIYIHDSNAAWVNGGLLYKLTTYKGALTKKQIKNIATSLK